MQSLMEHSNRRNSVNTKGRLRYGHVKPMSCQLGWGCNDKKVIAANRAKHGAVNRTGEFYDPGHLQLGALSVQKPEDTIDPCSH